MNNRFSDVEDKYDAKKVGFIVVIDVIMDHRQLIILLCISNYTERERVLGRFSYGIRISRRRRTHTVSFQKSHLAPKHPPTQPTNATPPPPLSSYKIGESFMHLPHSECLERIEKEKETTINELEALKKQMDEITDKMSKLKVLLYGKFGKSINLEHD